MTDGIVIVALGEAHRGMAKRLLASLRRRHPVHLVTDDAVWASAQDWPATLVPTPLASPAGGRLQSS